MTYRLDGHVFFNLRPIPGLVVVGLAALVAAGCASSTIDDAVPTAGVKNTGQFPNLNIPPEVAASQLTEEEKQAKMAALKGAQEQQAATAATATAETDEAELRKLAETHAAAALKAIEE